MMKKNNVNKVALVTGAASGLGKELVLRLANQGYNVIGADYNQQGLDDLKVEFKENGNDILCIQANIAELENVQSLMQQVEKNYGRLDLLINNAGIMQPFGRAETINYETIERIMGVNFWGTTYMTKEALPLLKQGDKPLLVNIASMGALMPTPGQSFYCASKAAVALMTETLSLELKDQGIDVMLACPGTMKTNIIQNAPYTAENDESRKEIVTSLEKGSPGITPAYAADKIISALKKRPNQLIIGMDALVLTNMHKVLPTLTNRIFSKMMKMNPALKKALQ